VVTLETSRVEVRILESLSKARARVAAKESFGISISLAKNNRALTVWNGWFMVS
jgi:hypothetical protein